MSIKVPIKVDCGELRLNEGHNPEQIEFEN